MHYCWKRHLLAVSRLETIGLHLWFRTHPVTHPLAENTDRLRPYTSRSSRLMYDLHPRGVVFPEGNVSHDMPRFSNAESSVALSGRVRGSR